MRSRDSVTARWRAAARVAQELAVALHPLTGDHDRLDVARPAVEHRLGDGLGGRGEVHRGAGAAQEHQIGRLARLDRADLRVQAQGLGAAESREVRASGRP